MAEVERPKIVFGYLEFAPYYFTNDLGLPEGPFIDLASDIAQEAGLDIEFLSLPTKRGLLAVATGEVGMWFGPLDHPLYKNNILTSKKPLMALELRVVSKKSMGNFSGIDDLMGKSIVVMRGYSYGNILEFISSPESKTELFQVINHTQGLQVLDTRNVDYFLNYTEPLREALKKYPIKNIRSKIISKLDLHIILNKDYPNAGLLLEKMEKVLWQHPFIKQRQQYHKDF